MSSYIDNKTKYFINEQNDDIINEYNEKKDHHLYRDDAKNNRKHKFIRLIKNNLDYTRVAMLFLSMFISYFLTFTPTVIMVYFVMKSCFMKQNIQESIINETNHLYDVLNKIKQKKID